MPSSSTRVPTRSIWRAVSSTCTKPRSGSTSALGRHGHRHGICHRRPAILRPASGARGRGRQRLGFSGMEVETICRYHLPVCVVIFNNDGIYRGTDVNSSGLPTFATTVLSKARATTR